MFELTDLLRAVIMGIIQAVTEFLPVSSSGHLVVMREFVHFDEQNNSLTFDVALHVGTSVAVILFFWRDWQNIFRLVPIAVFTRPTYTNRALAGFAAKRFARYRINEGLVNKLSIMKAPAWAFLNIKPDAISATRVRAGIGAIKFY